MKRDKPLPTWFVMVLLAIAIFLAIGGAVLQVLSEYRVTWREVTSEGKKSLN